MWFHERWRLVLGILGVMLTGMMPGLSAAQSGSTGPRYFGYYASAASWVGTGNYTAATSDHANVTWIAYPGLGDNTVAVNWHLERLREAQGFGMGGVLDVTGLFFDLGNTTRAPRYLRSDHLTRWQNYANQIAPYLGSVTAFYLLDEPYLHVRGDKAGIRDAINTVARAIKDRFPGKPVATIFDYASIQDDGTTYPSFEAAGLPSEIDWLGVDCYYTGSSFESCGGRSLVWYTNRLKQKMTASQRLILVPQAAYFGTQNQQPTALAAQATLLCRIEKEVAMALGDPRFIGIFPFTYQSQHLDYGGGIREDWIGPEHLPLVRRQYARIGNHVRSGTPLRAHPCAVSASQTYAGSVPENVVDGDSNTVWNAGAGANSGAGQRQWIELDLGDRTTVTRLRLQVEQAPAGPTHHIIYGGPTPNPQAEIGRFQQSTQALQWLELTGTLHDIRYVRIVTVDSPSWVSWREIEVYRAVPPSRVYALPVTASHNDNLTLLDLADANLQTLWQGGGFPARWVELDLGQVITARKIRLLPDQTPSGYTVHEIRGGASPNPTTLLGTLSGTTSTGQWIELNSGVGGIRYLRVLTTMSPSWVSWWEIEVYR